MTVAEPPVVRVVIDALSTEAPFDVQLNQAGIRVKAGRSYRLDFRARADAGREIGVGCGRVGPAWTSLGLYSFIRVEADWRAFELPFNATDDASDARIHFDVGGSLTVEISGLSLLPI